MTISESNAVDKPAALAALLRAHPMRPLVGTGRGMIVLTTARLVEQLLPNAVRPDETETARTAAIKLASLALHVLDFMKALPLAEAPGGLTPKQAKALHFIKRKIERAGVCPSFDEIASHIGKSKGTVQGIINGLIERGHLARGAGNRRNLRVIEG